LKKKKDTDEVCQENEDIDLISFIFNASYNEYGYKHGFSLDISDLVQTTTNGNPIDEDDERMKWEEKNIIDQDDSDEN